MERASGQQRVLLFATSGIPAGAELTSDCWLAGLARRAGGPAVAVQLPGAQVPSKVRPCAPAPSGPCGAAGCTPSPADDLAGGAKLSSDCQLKALAQPPGSPTSAAATAAPQADKEGAGEQVSKREAE